MSTMKAVIIKERGVPAVAEISRPKARPDYFIVKTVALAINPTDFHHTAGENVGRIGGIIGCDLSGIVEEVGEECKSDVKKGDRVFGVCHGADLSDTEHGAFADYALVRKGHFAKIPEGMSFEDAATFGVGVTSVGQALHMTMGIARLDEERQQPPASILVYGGSAATGTLAIQFAKLSGLTVISTASEKNYEMVKSRGADLVLDYKSPDFATKVQQYAKSVGRPIRYVLDCVSNEASYQTIAKALPEKDADQIQLVALLPLNGWPRKDVSTHAILAYTTMGKAFEKFGIPFNAMPDHFKFGVKWWKLAGQLIAEGKIKPHPVEVREGGLDGIPGGILDMSKGTVSGVKLVYRVDETGTERTVIAEKVEHEDLSNHWVNEKEQIEKREPVVEH